MKATPALLLAASLLCGSAFAQNVPPADDYPNVSPGFPLVIQASGTASANGLINYADDLDVFSFQAGANGGVAVYTTGVTDTKGILRRQTSSGWSTVATEEGGTGNFRISRVLDPGLYSIQVSGRLNTIAGAVSGPYGLRVEFTPVTPPQPGDIEVPEVARDGNVAFGPVALNTSVTKSFTLRNAGTGNLQINGVTVAGTAAGGVVGNDPATMLPFLIENGGARTLAPGASSTVRVVFKPLTAGNFTGVVNIGSNDPDENPYTFTVTGSGNQPPPPVTGEIAVSVGNADVPSGGTVDFGAVLVPSTAPVVREVVISNTGDANLMLGAVVIAGLPIAGPLPSAPPGFFRVVTPPAAVVEPGRSTVLRIAAGGNDFTVQALRYVMEATIQNSDADENPYRLLLSANVTTPPPPAPGEIDVLSGDVLLTNNARLDFGTTRAGTPVTKTLTIKNSGDGELRLNSIVVEWSGAVIAIFPPPPVPFRVEGVEPRVVGPGASTTCRVIFPATSPGDAEAVLRINNTDADENPFSLTLLANAEGDPPPPSAPEIAVGLGNADVPNGGTVDFGRTPLTVPVRKTIRISNSGTGPLQVRAAFQAVTRAANTLTPFRFAGEPFSTVAPGASRELPIVFQPVTNGMFQTMLVISNNDSDENPYRLKLTGQGGTDSTAVPDIALSLGSAQLAIGSLVDFGTAAPGSSVTKEIKISNTGAGDLRLGRVSFAANTATPAGGANAAGEPAVLPPVGALPFRALLPPNNVVPAGGFAILRVVYMAPPSGSQTAMMTIESNDPDENPWRLVLKGTSTGTAPVPPEIAVSSRGADLPIGGTLSFGDVTIAMPVRREISIANTGGGELRIAGFSILPAETLANDGAVFLPPPALVRVVSGPGIIPAGGTGVFVLEMIGFSPGEAKLQARISNNDPDENPYSFGITGTIGNPPPPPIDPPVNAP